MHMVALDFTSTLQSALSAVFNNVLSPVLVTVFNTLVNLAMTIIQDVLAEYFFMIWVVLLKLVAFFEDVFNVFAGLSSVGTYDAAAGTYVSTGKSFLDYLFYTDAVQTTLWAMVLIGFALIFLTSMVATLNSMGDSIMDNKRPVSAVVRDALKAAFTVITIPAMCVLMLTVMNTLTVVVNETVFGDNGDDISDTIFITLAGPAAKTDAIRLEYSTGNAYANDNAVDDFNEGDINYIYAYAVTAFIVVIMFFSIMQFIQRIFMLLLLSLVAPFIAVSIPLDGGKKFKDWKKAFLAYSIAGMGPIMAMQLYLIIVGGLLSGDSLIVFNASATVSAMIEVMLLAGGMYAIYCSRNLYVTIVDPHIAQTMDASISMIMSPAQFVGGKMKEHSQEKKQEKKEQAREMRNQG